MQITFFMTTQARLESFQNAHKRFSLNPSMCTYSLKMHTEDLPCTLQTFQSGTQDASFCKNQNYVFFYFLFFMNYKYRYLYIVYIYDANFKTLKTSLVITKIDQKTKHISSHD